MAFRWSRRQWATQSGLAALTQLTGSWATPAALAAPLPEKVLKRTRSPFNEIVVTERGSVRTMYFVVEGVRYIESRWDMAHPHSLDLDYARTMMAGFLIDPLVKRVAMIGLGGGQISNYLFERFPALEIDAVDIDPEVVALAHAYFGVPQHPRYRTHVADGRLFVERASQPWDMLLLDAFRGVFVPYHLKTLEFYQQCAKKLNAHAVVVANLHNQVKMYSSDQCTLQRVFASTYNFASESGNQTTFVGSPTDRPLGAFALREHARELSGRFDFDLMGLAARHYLHRDWEHDAPILRDDFEPNDLHKAVNRHNAACFSDCVYSTKR